MVINKCDIKFLLQSNFSWFDDSPKYTGHTPGKMTFPLPPGIKYEEMLLGVAMEKADGSRGIQWAKCLYRYKTGETTLTDNI